ncbi:MAG TPA: HAMP domain-containing sensor histidine kinase [Actinomycetota bacterium]|nr:HAMP domain-containing sensor histidine kinase [Actinomycetota bacterium]
MQDRGVHVSTKTKRKSEDNPGLKSIRARLLGAFVALLVVATVASVVVVRAILVNQANERIDAELVQEAREVRRLSTGSDPETGDPFRGRVRRIFEVFLERNIPARHEAQLTFVDGEPYLRSRAVVPYRLDQDPELVSRWADLEESDRGVVETPEGPVEYLAVPVQSEGDTRGVFVVAVFRDLWLEEIEPAIAGAAGVGAIVVLIGSLLAWRLADRILGPVEKVTHTARAISESDLRRRIAISGDDEIARLAQTFNEMLDRLEEAFLAQRRFIDDASHELRTPITVIQGQLEVLGEDPEDRRKALEIVMDELGRMTRFVNDLLLLARSDRPDFLTLDSVDVTELFDEIFAKAQSLAPRRWTLDRSGRGRIIADRQRLTQAVMQLAQNAAQHTRDGDEIGLGAVVENGEARFWVRDSGPGVAPGDQADVFERFRRGRGARGASDGAGLGLSIVKAIAEAHHGDVDLTSKPGEGATFAIRVPVDQPHPKEELPA